MKKVGEQDSTGATIKAILGQNPRVQVYTTEDGQLRWNYQANDGDVPDELRSAISKFDLLMSETKTIAPARHKAECFLLLGKSLYAALNEVEESAALECFKGYERYFHRLARQQSRAKYVLVSMIVAGIISSVLGIALHAWDLRHEQFFYGALFGALGACVSVMQRAKDIDIDWTLEHWALLLQAFVRVSLGLVFGAILVLACKADFLFGAFKDKSTALYLLALVAGFSERMIPDLFARLEASAGKDK